MQVTSVGHAGFRIDTQAGSILCDPWVNPAYFASWFPFPDNSHLDWDALGDVDYLYISHLHKDHFDPVNLRAHVNKDAVVLLPDYPVPDLQRELEQLGFHRFFETTDSVKHTVNGPKGDLDVMIIALRAPADGPIGDSGLVVDDGETVCFNMNDARPIDLDVLHADFGQVDVHMLQYSGAIWYPMVYDMPARAKEAFGTQKRQRQMDRCRQYIAQVGATWVIPSAGPPCFLDPELRHLNDDHGDPANIFPDQMVFLEQMRRHGHDRGLLMIPGSTADFTGPQLNSLRHPVPDDEVQAIFTTGKAAYIADYADRMAPVLAAEKARWAPAAGESLLEPLRAFFEPIMSQSDQICDGIGYPVELRLEGEAIAKPWCWTSRNAQCANRFRTRSSVTASPSPRSWCGRCCAMTNRTGSTPSSCPPGFRRGGSAATTNTCTRSSSACPTSGSPTRTAGSPRRTTTPPRSSWTASRSSAAART